MAHFIKKHKCFRLRITWQKIHLCLRNVKILLFTKQYLERNNFVPAEKVCIFFLHFSILRVNVNSYNDHGKCYTLTLPISAFFTCLQIFDAYVEISSVLKNVAIKCINAVTLKNLSLPLEIFHSFIFLLPLFDNKFVLWTLLSLLVLYPFQECNKICNWVKQGVGSAFIHCHCSDIYSNKVLVQLQKRNKKVMKLHAINFIAHTILINTFYYNFLSVINTTKYQLIPPFCEKALYAIIPKIYLVKMNCKMPEIGGFDRYIIYRTHMHALFSKVYFCILIPISIIILWQHKMNNSLFSKEMV